MDGIEKITEKIAADAQAEVDAVLNEARARLAGHFVNLEPALRAGLPCTPSLTFSSGAAARPAAAIRVVVGVALGRVRVSETVDREQVAVVHHLPPPLVPAGDSSPTQRTVWVPSAEIDPVMTSPSRRNRPQC